MTGINPEYKHYWNALITEATHGTHRTFELDNTIIYDLPRASGELHGSSIAIDCNDEECSITADLVVPQDPDLLNVINHDIKNLNGCVIADIHPAERPLPSYHVHVVCSVNVNNVGDVIKYMRWF